MAEFEAALSKEAAKAAEVEKKVKELDKLEIGPTSKAIEQQGEECRKLSAMLQKQQTEQRDVTKVYLDNMRDFEEAKSLAGHQDDPGTLFQCYIQQRPC